MSPNMQIAASVALIFFGVRFLRKGLIRTLGAKFDRWLETISKSRRGSALAGSVFGIFAPSSTTQSVLAINMVKSNKLPVNNMLVFLLFANAGITFSIQLLSLQIHDYYPLLLVGGISLFLLVKSSNLWKGLGQIMTAFGFIFLAMSTISQASKLALGNPEAIIILKILDSHPFWLAIMAAAASVLTQSSMAIVGIALAVGSANPTLSALLFPVVLGSSLGIGFTTLLVGWSSLPGRVLGISSIFTKLLILLPLLYYLPLVGAKLAETNLPLTQQAGLLHAVANLTIALLGLMISPITAPWLSTLFKREEIRHDVINLDYALLHKPLQAAACASGELFKMSQGVQKMYREAWRAFDIGSPELARQVIKEDDNIDRMEENITTYLGRLAPSTTNNSEQHLVFGLINFAVQLEGVADLISHQICPFIVKNEKRKISLSNENQQQLQLVRTMVGKRLEQAGSVLVSRDQQMAREFLAEGLELKHQVMSILKSQYLQWQEGHDHFSATIFVEILHSLRRISSLLNTIGHTFSTSLLEEADNAQGQT
jgi:phosphate:Na+ symporter